MFLTPVAAPRSLVQAPWRHRRPHIRWSRCLDHAPVVRGRQPLGQGLEWGNRKQFGNHAGSDQPGAALPRSSNPARSGICAPHPLWAPRELVRGRQARASFFVGRAPCRTPWPHSIAAGPQSVRCHRLLTPRAPQRTGAVADSEWTPHFVARVHLVGQPSCDCGSGGESGCADPQERSRNPNWGGSQLHHLQHAEHRHRAARGLLCALKSPRRMRSSCCAASPTHQFLRSSAGVRGRSQG